MGVFNVSLIILVIVTCIVVSSTGKIPTVYRLNYKRRTQTEPMPNCTVQFGPNSYLNTEYVLESYDGTMRIICNATIPGQTIKNATMEALLQTANNRNFTLAFIFYCNNYTGSVDLMYLDRRNLILYKIVECLLSPTDITYRVYNPEHDNLVYYQNDNSFMHPLPSIESSLNISLYGLSMPCGIGRKTRYFIENGPNTHDMYVNEYQTKRFLHNLEGKTTHKYQQLLKKTIRNNTPKPCSKLMRYEFTDNNRSIYGINFAILAVLQTAPNLQWLNVSATGLTDVPATVVDKVETPSLYTVDMSRNNITRFSFNFKLLKDIMPSDNYTKSVILTRCQIETILLENVQQMVQYPFVHVDISDNPIHCNCDLKPALEYMYNNSDYFNTSYYRYLWDMKCVAPPALRGVRLCDVAVDELCPTAPDKVRTVLAPLLSMGVLLILVVITSICLYRHRTTVQALVHNFICIKCCPSKYIDYENQGRNGVFVTYSYDDVEVADNIIERLQTNIPPIRVNSERDMMANAPWTELDRMVRTSTYTVMLLSKNFMDDPECLMVFKMAYEQSINERRQSLIAVMVGTQEELGEIQDANLKLFLRFNTSLIHNQVWFWEKLVHALLRNPQNVVFDREEMELVSMQDNEMELNSM